MWFSDSQYFILNIFNTALLSSQNRVMKRDMLESLSRCYAYLGDVKNALTIVEDLVNAYYANKLCVNNM